ncbi:Ion channel [Cooperia oncophora]
MAKKTPLSDVKTYTGRYTVIRRGSMRAYDTWKREFILDRCCNENDFIKELVVSATPHVLLNLLLVAYLLFGTVLLQYADEGYGNVVPTTNVGKLVCIGYCADVVSKGLPLWLSIMLLCLHSLLGGLIFSTWMGQMRFIDAVYCSFISVATIGYGDLVPVPDTWGHTVAIIAFLSAGVVILSTLFDRFGCYLQYVHYIGRRFRGRKDVEIWFGGSVLTVQELITLVAEQFGVCPRRLRAVLRNLDSILEAACDETGKGSSESLYKNGAVVPNESCAISIGSGDPRAVLLAKDPSDVYATVTPLYRIASNSSLQKLSVRDTEIALQALRVIHHKLNKTTLRQSARERKPLDVRRTLTE